MMLVTWARRSSISSGVGPGSGALGLEAWRVVIQRTLLSIVEMTWERNGRYSSSSCFLLQGIYLSLVESSEFTEIWLSQVVVVG